ncbi:MAG: cytochrome P450 [Pirellulaceae bacterium]
MRASTTQTLLDLAVTGISFAMPRLLGASPQIAAATAAIAIGRAGYLLISRAREERGSASSSEATSGLEMAGGLAVTAVPVLMRSRLSPAMFAFAVGGCALEALLSKYTDPAPDHDGHSLGLRGVNSGTTAQLPGENQSSASVPAELQVPEAEILDSLKVGLGVALPTLAMGPIMRRPTMMMWAETLDLAGLGVLTLRSLRDKYGDGPLMVQMPFRHQAVILDPEDLRRVIDGSPEPFALASVAKQAALAHFEPKSSLISHGAERTARRRLNEETLEQHSPIHSLAENFLPIVEEEAQRILKDANEVGELRWDEFSKGWFSMVRRVVFGEAARHDTRISYLMSKLRSDGNWAFLKPIDTDLRAELHHRIRGYLDRAEPGSLVAKMAAKATSEVESPENQIPQWLFAFDPAGMATYRGLALLARHPQEMQRAYEESTGNVSEYNPHRPFLRATILESLRLWPTTPMILRQTTEETKWENGILPAHTGILIYTPLFHRDETTLPFAHQFYPQVWIDDDPEVQGAPPSDWPLVPFSGGPGICPGRNLVLLLTSAMLAALIGDRTFELKDPQRLIPGDLPGTLNHFTLTFDVQGFRNELAGPPRSCDRGYLKISS